MQVISRSHSERGAGDVGRNPWKPPKDLGLKKEWEVPTSEERIMRGTGRGKKNRRNVMLNVRKEGQVGLAHETT